VSELTLIALVLALHLVALVAGGALIVLALRGGDIHEQSDDGDEDDGGGGPPRDHPRRPLGGPPLLEATPARARLRGPARLADLRRRQRSRYAHEPQRPAPTSPVSRGP
jgi:hypothetical protein